MASTITIRVTDDEKAQLEQLAEETGMNISQLVRKGIKEVIDKNEKGSLEISEY